MAYNSTQPRSRMARMARNAILAATTATAAVSSDALAEEAIAQGQWVQATKLTLGCPAYENIVRIAELAREQDIQAIKAYFHSVGCQAVEAGAAGFVEDSASHPPIVCIRMKGQPDCTWLLASDFTAAR